MLCAPLILPILFVCAQAIKTSGSKYSNQIRRQFNGVTGEICADGAQAVASCIAGLCGSGFYCNGRRLCCRGAGPPPTGVRCLDGSASQGTCRAANSGECPPGTVCTTSFICCPRSALQPGIGTATPIPAPPPARSCSQGGISIGECRFGLCQSGYVCDHGLCCSLSADGSCPVGRAALGPCLNGVCAVNAECMGNLCCVLSVQVVCPGGVPSIGFCNEGGLCRAGYACIGTACCPTTGGSVFPTPFQPVQPIQPVQPFQPTVPIQQPTGQAQCNSGQFTSILCNFQIYSQSGCPSNLACENGGCCVSDGSNSVVPSNPIAQISVTCANGIVSTTPCNYNSIPSTGCTNGFTCYNGACCQAIFNPNINPGQNQICPNGAVSNTACNLNLFPSNNGCQSGTNCQNGVCCGAVVSNANACPNGLTASSNCNYFLYPQTGCGGSMSCQNNLCCPFSDLRVLCPNGQITVTICNFGTFSSTGCPSNLACQNGGCCELVPQSQACASVPGTVATEVCNFSKYPGVGCSGGGACTNGFCCTAAVNIGGLNGGRGIQCPQGQFTFQTCDFNRYLGVGCAVNFACLYGGCCPVTTTIDPNAPIVTCPGGQQTQVLCNFETFPVRGCAPSFSCRNGGCCAVDGLIPTFGRK